MSEKLEILKKKLLYRASYRGTKEMDILLSSFVKNNIEKLDIDLLKELEKFLEFEDETILNFYNFNIIDKNIDKNLISKIFKNFKV
jgi:antitoxin CptB